jgi:hypothetical protein
VSPAVQRIYMLRTPERGRVQAEMSTRRRGSCQPAPGGAPPARIALSSGRSPVVLTVKCFTDDQLRRGLEAVILAHLLAGDRCLVCGEENHDAHDAQAHAFLSPDPFAVFLEAASGRAEEARAEKSQGEGLAQD